MSFSQIVQVLVQLPFGLGWIAMFTAAAVLVYALNAIAGFIRYIPNDRLAVLERLWSFRGSVPSGLIALKGEAGFAPDVVRGGYHAFTPFQYRIHEVPLVTIPQGQIGYVFARDGVALSPTQTLASNAAAGDFQNARAFLMNGGQKGPQRKILREGTYAINLAQFVVLTRDKTYAIPLGKDDAVVFARMGELISTRHGFEPLVIKDADDFIGVVTVHDGPALPDGEIIAPTVANTAGDLNFHNNFQDPEKFLDAGGYRGRQHQVLVDGSYYLNRLFATVELVPKTTIDVGTVGVVVSYTGKTRQDLSGEAYQIGRAHV